MTDKQIGSNVPSKSNKFKLGRTKIERQQIFENIKEMVESGYSLQNIADKYGVTRQAISLKMVNNGFNVSQEVKRIKRDKIRKLLEETSLNNIEKLNRKLKCCKIYNIELRNDLTTLKEQLDQLKAENDELKNFHINLVGVKECEIKELVKYKQALTEIKQLLEDALDTDKTNAEQSFDNFYKAIKLCEVLDEN